MTREEIQKEYPYLYDTHVHTKETSACGQATAAEIVNAYKEAGYTGIIITDHNWYGNCGIDRSLPWEEFCTQFFKGYQNAYEEGQKVGLQVFPGYESAYDGTEFLIYGLTPEDVINHPELKEATIKEQLDIVHSLNGMVIQAHPFRNVWYIDAVRIYPGFVDGVEGLNASQSNQLNGNRDKAIWDEKAMALAKERALPMTAGSDQHSTTLFMGGMAFKTPVSSMEDFIMRVKNKADYVITNGREYYSNTGELLVKWKD